MPGERIRAAPWILRTHGAHPGETDPPTVCGSRWKGNRGPENTEKRAILRRAHAMAQKGSSMRWISPKTVNWHSVFGVNL